MHLDQAVIIPESHCGFRTDKGTIDMIFTARQLQEKCQEQNVDLYMSFVDLTKAFDTVGRDGLRKIMAKFGCPPRFIAMVRQFHYGMQARVQNYRKYSEPFPVTNGVKQGCVKAPTLFSMVFSAKLTYAFNLVLRTNYSTSGCKPNLRCGQMSYTQQKRKFTFLDRNFSNFTQTHYFERYVYIQATRRTRQPYKNVSKLIRR